MDVSVEEVMAEEVGGKVEEIEEYTSKEVVEESAAHIKMELTSHMSPVILKIQSGTHSQTIQGK